MAIDISYEMPNFETRDLNVAKPAMEAISKASEETVTSVAFGESESMKSLFRGYYRPDDDDFASLWRDATFVLDANVLLNLHRYPRKVREELIGVFTRIADRLWVPYQGALEYQRNRLAVIAEQKQRFHDVRKAVTDGVQKLESELSNLQNRHALINPTNLIATLKQHIDKYLAELENLEKEQGDVNDSDPVREEIEKLRAWPESS